MSSAKVASKKDVETPNGRRLPKKSREPPAEFFSTLTTVKRQQTPHKGFASYSAHAFFRDGPFFSKPEKNANDSMTIIVTYLSYPSKIEQPS